MDHCFAQVNHLGMKTALKSIQHFIYPA